MKNYFLLLITMALIAIVLPSCTSTLPNRFDSFVSSVEKNYSSYSQDDWAKAHEKFQNLFSEYQENKSSFNSDEKKQINSAVARYVKVSAKSGIEDITESISEITEQIPALIDEAKSFLQELGL